MIELEKIPHIHEISNHGPYHGAREKNTATFQARSTRQNKLVPSLEEAIRRTGLKDGMTISFHHHFRNGDHIIVEARAKGDNQDAERVYCFCEKCHNENPPSNLVD